MIRAPDRRRASELLLGGRHAALGASALARCHRRACVSLERSDVLPKGAGSAAGSRTQTWSSSQDAEGVRPEDRGGARGGSSP